MSKSEMLRVLVNQRLSAVAAEIFTLFEMTIEQYEEELSRCKKDNQRKQQLLDAVLNPTVRLQRSAGGVGIQVPSPRKSLESTGTTAIKEEPEELYITETQEEEPLPVPVPESSGVCVKREVPSQLHMGENEFVETIQEEYIGPGEDFLLQTEGDMAYFPDAEHFSNTGHSSDTGPSSDSEDSSDSDDSSDTDHSSSDSEQSSDSDSDTDEDLALRGPDALMETEGKGDHSQVHMGEQSLDAQNSGLLSLECMSESELNNGDMSKTRNRADRKKNTCPFCSKKFRRKHNLEKHIQTHTGEVPHDCPICEKKSAQNMKREKSVVYRDLQRHMRSHSSHKPHSCPMCNKTFAQKYQVAVHMRTHTGEKPYSCAFCSKTFAQKGTLDAHTRIHTGEKPYICLICNRPFTQNSSLKIHMKIHVRDSQSWLTNQ